MRRSTSTIWRAERGEERGEGRAEADAGWGERGCHRRRRPWCGGGRLRSTRRRPAAADSPAHRPPNLLLSCRAPIGFLPNPSAGLPTQTRRKLREKRGKRDDVAS
uniref:Uncharacterized protein n=1 Tax=Oryza meridionalis TaxID=40149 RepID=A0A0E0CJH8_9ORYZ